MTDSEDARRLCADDFDVARQEMLSAFRFLTPAEQEDAIADTLSAMRQLRALNTGGRHAP